MMKMTSLTDLLLEAIEPSNISPLHVGYFQLKPYLMSYFVEEMDPRS